ncbi:MAG TPA: hypothetical protein VF553_20160 [Pyrinomonadaceae bacterium]|jgi:hypothetical protein
MKRCPTCNRTYTDDALSFCLDDGAPLLSTGGDAPSSFDPNATLAYPTPRETTPTPPVSTPRVTPSTQPQPPQSNWSQGPSAQMPYPQQPPPPRKRSALPWILGGAALLLVLGIGFVVLIAILAAMSADSNSNRTTSNASRPSSNTNSRTSTSNTSSGSTGSTLVVRDDFSSETWTTDGDENKYEDGEYHMHTDTGNYIVVLAPDQSKYYTKDRTIRVTARSVDGTASNYGYGLVVHGTTKTGHPVGYSFLLYTGNDPSYAVRHLTGDEDKALVKWTSSSVVRSGTNPNQIEVRIKGNQLSYYVNGQYVTSITDSAGYGDGRAGFFTSNENPVAFDDLEIYK